MRLKHRDTFIAVLHNADDQVAVRQILEDVLTPAQKEEVVRRFNLVIDQWNERAAEELGPFQVPDPLLTAR